MCMNRDGLLGTIVENLKVGSLHQFWTLVAQTELGCPDAADHPVGREAIHLG